MPNWCSNKIVIKPVDNSVEAKKQLKELVELIKSTKLKNTQEIKLLQLLFPMPDELNIDSGAATSFGEAVIMSTKFDDHTKIDIINNYPWAKDMSRDDLIIHLVETKEANLENGQKVIDNKKLYGCETWYEWRVKNWGTKWDILIYEMKLSNKRIKINGDTAWSPPVSAFVEISKKFNLLNFSIEFFEPCCGFEGTAEINNGDCDSSYENTIGEE